MPEEEVIVEYSTDKGSIEIELVVGQKRRGGFEIDYFDKDDEPIQHEVGSVENGDPANFTLEGSPDNSDGALLGWMVTVERTSTKAGQPWVVTMFIRQNGKTLKNGRRQKNGTFDEGELAVFVADQVRLNAK